MGLFRIILENVNLNKKDKEQIHEVIKHSKPKKDEKKKTKSHERKKAN
jgi:hypothetical protein